MNNFEFLRTLNLGQYIPTGSWVHRLDPRARIVALFFLLAAVTFAPSLPGLAIALAAVIGLLVAARIPLGFALRNLLPPLPFLAILAVLQVFMNAGKDPATVIFAWGWLRLTTVGLLSGLLMLLRFGGLILALSLASFCISTSELIHGLEALLNPLTRLGLPTRDLVMMIQVMLRFLPFLAMAAERIAKAQASRGASWGTPKANLVERVRQVAPLIVPLFLTGLRRAENLAMAMDARGYGNPVHTSMAVMRFQTKDALAILLSAGFAVALIIL